jgi:hypothetical protein
LQRITRQEKLQGTKGRCTEYHHTSQGEQVTAMSGIKETMKMKKKKWGRYALPEGFAKTQVPKGFKLPHDQ